MANYGSLLINGRLLRTTHEDWFFHLIFHAGDAKIYEEINGEIREEKHLLSAPARFIMERMSVLGYTESQMREDFAAFRQEKIDDLTFHIEEDFTIDVDTYVKERRFWKKHQLEDFLKSVSKLVHDPKWKIRSVPFEKVYSNIDNYILDEPFDLLDRLPFNSEMSALRAFLMSVEPETPLVFDYTELYDGGELTDEDVLSYNSDKPKIIILTEGSSDIAILKSGLNLLYPHLEEIYSFFDFESFNAQGGSGSLVNMVKSFAGAGVNNNVIALFDNDTAAREAQTSLKDLTFPARIKLVNCPHIAFAEDYPTLGPTGLNNMNINGLACSIELYLGEDVLKDEKSNFLPILWKGYSTKMEAYQGEIMSKKEIQSRFFQKLSASRKDQTFMNAADWRGLISIFEMIFDSFNSQKNHYRSTLTKVD
jgi:hypothetical protein